MSLSANIKGSSEFDNTQIGHVDPNAIFLVGKIALPQHLQYSGSQMMFSPALGFCWIPMGALAEGARIRTGYAILPPTGGDCHPAEAGFPPVLRGGEVGVYTPE